MRSQYRLAVPSHPVRPRWLQTPGDRAAPSHPRVLRTSKSGRVLLLLGPVFTLTFAALNPAPSAGADQLPSYCGPVGAQLYQPAARTSTPPVSIPAIIIDRGRNLLVNSASDEVNGDVSSVSGLIARPGPDGISLREAITAANNSPGGLTIGFAPFLKGAVIKVGPSPLPQLRSGSVTINGDVDGDAKPDVTLENNGVDEPNPMGLKIAAGDITVYAIAIRGFSCGVILQAASINQTYANIAIANNDIKSVAHPKYGGGAIILHSGSDSRGNRWTDITVAGNTIEASNSGIEFMLHFSTGDRLEHVTVSKNILRMLASKGSAIGFGAGFGPNTSENIISIITVIENTVEGAVQSGIRFSSGDQGSTHNAIRGVRIKRNTLRLAPVRDNMGITAGAGHWAGSSGNTIRDLQISDNVIEGSSETVIRVAAGDVGSSNNTVEGVGITGNRLDLKTGPGGTYGPTVIFGIQVVVGDAATDWQDPNFRPISYSENNLVRDVTVENNLIDGPGSGGIAVDLGCLGNRRNSIRDVLVRNNTITRVGFGTTPTYGVRLSGGSSSSPVGRRRTGENQMTNIVVERNTVRLAPVTRYTQSGGIAVLGGEDGAELNQLSDVWISRNDVEPGGVIGLNVTGGYGAQDFQAGRNVISRVEAWCNVVRQPPDRNTPALQGLKGVAAIGGFYGAVDNRLDQIRLTDNLVAGILDDYSVVTNLDQRSSGNSVSVLQTSKPAPAPVIASGGVVNGASFGPGVASTTWISVFGNNLAPVRRSWWASDFVGAALPTELEGTVVRINGRPAYPAYISPTQINALAPDDPTEGLVSIEVTTPAGKSSPAMVDKRRLAPAFFLFEPEGRRYVASVHADGTYVGKANLFSGALARPARPGEVIMLFGTGFGPTDPPSSTGQLVSQAAAMSTPVRIRIGIATADVAFAGLVMPGLYQFNVTVPDLPDGDHSVVAEASGFSSQPGVYITVQRH